MTVKTNPSGQTCTVANGSGTMASANMTNVAITCTANGGGGTTYSVGGTVSGLSGTVVLQDNGGDNLSVSANGSFTFATQLASGAGYAVTVQTNPSGSDLHGGQRLGHGRLGQRDQRGGYLHRRHARASASDNFNRADGGLGPNWTAISDGGMAISSQQVIGSQRRQNTGEIRTAESYPQ